MTATRDRHDVAGCLVSRLSDGTRLRQFPSRRNSLNFLRLVLATLVIVSHAWPLGGLGEDPHVGAVTLGYFAVAGFFAISGWLITESRFASELPRHAWRWEERRVGKECRSRWSPYH